MAIVLMWRRYKLKRKSHYEVDIPLYINIGLGFFLVNIGRIVACVCAWCKEAPIMVYWYEKAGLIGGYKP